MSSGFPILLNQFKKSRSIVFKNLLQENIYRSVNPFIQGGILKLFRELNSEDDVFYTRYTKWSINVSAINTK